jgi:hypothetical protein
MAGYSVERSETIDAPTQHVHGLVNDFHRWTRWSPWEDVDPDLERTFTGPDQGVGAQYSWSGNRKAGAGRMEIVGSSPTAIDVTLDFVKPFKSLGNQVHFSFVPEGERTRVLWRIGGQYSGLMSVMGRFMNMEKMIGPDLEKGLRRLKSTAEGPDTAS